MQNNINIVNYLHWLSLGMHAKEVLHSQTMPVELTNAFDNVSHFNFWCDERVVAQWASLWLSSPFIRLGGSGLVRRNSIWLSRELIYEELFIPISRSVVVNTIKRRLLFLVTEKTYPQKLNVYPEFSHLTSCRSCRIPSSVPQCFFAILQSEILSVLLLL